MYTDSSQLNLSGSISMDELSNNVSYIYSYQSSSCLQNLANYVSMLSVAHSPTIYHWATNNYSLQI